MRDKHGFIVPCVNTEWRIIDQRDNHDFVCMRFGDRMSGYHLCHGDENCRYYKPDINDEHPLGFCPHQE